MNIYHSVQEWQDHRTDLIVLIDSDEIVGSVRVFNYPEDKESWIHSLFVDEKYRNQGVARLLLDEADPVAIYKPACVALEKNAPSWLYEFYRKRCYKIVE